VAVAPWAPAGIPVLIAAFAAVAVGLWPRAAARDDDSTGGEVAP
jgi:hypothetical protein